MSGIDATEKASLSIGHNLGFTACVEQTQQESLICIKGQNECLGIAAGSAFHATTLSAHSDTAVTVTATPSLYHHVNASGEGSATAELVFSQTNAATLDITADCASMDCPAKGGSHLVVFSEKHMQMAYSPPSEKTFTQLSQNHIRQALSHLFSQAP